jgi:hypothetical protein
MIMLTPTPNHKDYAFNIDHKAEGLCDLFDIAVANVQKK